MWLQPQEYIRAGGVLAAAREAGGITQAQLARKLNKPQSFVSSYENGQRRVDVLEFVRIVRAIGANPAKVFAEIADIGRLPKVAPSKR
jgi:transcriptional regulator with XRE-family HTH domain